MLQGSPGANADCLTRAAQTVRPRAPVLGPGVQRVRLGPTKEISIGLSSRNGIALFKHFAGFGGLFAHRPQQARFRGRCAIGVARAKFLELGGIAWKGGMV